MFGDRRVGAPVPPPSGWWPCLSLAVFLPPSLPPFLPSFLPPSLPPSLPSFLPSFLESRLLSVAVSLSLSGKHCAHIHKVDRRIECDDVCKILREALRKGQTLSHAIQIW